MSKIFRRPMFRKGGNVGDGIMTGIVDREMHAESDPNGVGGQSLSTAERLQKAYDKYPDQSIDPIAQLLIQGGLGAMSTTGGGGTFGNIAKAFKDPTDQLFKTLNNRGKEKRQLGLEGEVIDIKQEGALQLAKEKAIGDINATSKIQNANAMKAVYAPKIKAIEDQIILKKQQGATAQELVPLITQLQSLQLTSENAYVGALTSGKSRQEQIVDIATAIKENDFSNLTNEEIIKQATDIYNMAGGLQVTKANGGRIGYAQGTPEQPMMNTAAASQLESELGNSSMDIPYEDFRKKLPANITDDIAQIIYYNPRAFSDFANIETQEDVYSFNSKYDVSLVLPFNTETT